MCTFRIILILKIVSLIDIIPPRSFEEFNEVYIVMEYMETDLRSLIGSKQELSDNDVKYFLYQILRGLKYLHSAQVLHRDIKPENILINSDMDVKICDFGLSRGVDFENNPHTTQYVATRWYRAPELLLNWGQSTKEVDVWGVGCILAELIQKRRRRKIFPLFPGQSHQHQVQLIVKVLGNPKPEEIRACDAARRYVMQLPPSQKTDFKVKFSDANQLAVDLLERMLTFDPLQRISVEDALAHPYLAELHDINDEPSAELFNFSFEHQDITESDTIKSILQK
jgi:mitogen-activated protein kinase 6